MSRSHPPTLLTLVKRTLSRECSLPRGTHVLLAVSGGPDSMAMLHALSMLREPFGLVLSAHGVDHGLRAGAADELELARAFAEKLGVPYSTSRLKLAKAGNLQARAREARYASLRRRAAALGASLIATAHHADDRAETVLLRLLRGSGIAGLGVLPVHAKDLLRPLIRATRADIEAHLYRHRIPFSNDPSNRDPRFLRVRVRSQLMPLLAELSPAIVQHLTRLADEALAYSLSVGDRRVVQDAAGQVVTLNRAQASELGRLLAERKPGARIAIRGRREIQLDQVTGEPRVVEPTRSSRGRSQQGRSRHKMPK